MIGKLQRVALREVWKHEALDFARWAVEATRTRVTIYAASS